MLEKLSYSANLPESSTMQDFQFVNSFFFALKLNTVLRNIRVGTFYQNRDEFKEFHG